MTFEEELKATAEGVEEVIRSYLPKEEGFQRTVLEAMNYSVTAGGKRLRPLIMLETYRLFDGHTKVIEPFMAAIEFIHTSSLIHDDLPCMDNDEYRRGRKTTWKVYGEDMGVLAGDALLMYAFETAASAFSLHENPQKLGKAIRILAEKTGINGMIGGQTLDVELTGHPINSEQMDFIYRLKTGALLEASMMIGAVLSEASKEDIETCGQIAAKIGYAFQIRDDILDITSSDEVLGKPVHSDEKNEKTTYAALYGVEEAEKKVTELTDEALSLMKSLTGENRFLENLFLSLMRRDK